MSFPKMFVGGGGVLHGIQGNFQGKVSAWFDGYGQVVSAEQFRRDGRVYNVREGGPVWKQAQSVVNSFVRPTVLVSK